MRALRALAKAALVALAACVGTDDSPGFGSVQYTFVKSAAALDGLVTADDYRLTIDRFVLGFKTMTVGKIGTPDVCSYRGRGAASNVVFDLDHGVVQTFNGVSPVLCPDVGMIFGLVDNDTTPFDGTPSSELVELAEGGYHALLDATVTAGIGDSFEGGPPIPGASWKIQLRFDPVYTSSRFGGCKGSVAGQVTRGVQIREDARQTLSVVVAPENFFREGISTGVDFRAAPFVQADEQGNDDGVVTMAEVDKLALVDIDGNDYSLPPEEGIVKGLYPTLGDFVRYLFRFTMRYETEDGECVGNPPGDTNP